MAEEIERVHYYQNEYLGAEDFKAEQAYHRDMRRRHNVGHHRWGIVTGLELVQIEKGNGSGSYDVYIYPGLAVDGFGREIVVLEPYKLDAALFASINASRVCSVWISYRELTDTPPASGYESCDGADQNKRVHEEFVAVIEPPAPTHQAIVIDGKTPPIRTLTTPATQVSIYDDESVPHQDFPEAVNARWLVRLGSVSWVVEVAGSHFGQATDADLIAGREYTRIVAAEVMTPSDTFTLRQRGPTDPAKVDDKAFATVKGQLQVDGRIVAKKNLYMQGGRVVLQGDGGAELNNVPLWIKRIDGTGSDLRVHIGPDTGSSAEKRLRRLTVGPGTDETNPNQTTEKSVLAVTADDTIDIATGRVFFGPEAPATPRRQMLNLRAETYGIGVQTSTLYQRSESGFAWYRGGVHADGQGDSGGGTTLLQLDGAGQLTVTGPVVAPSLQTSNVYVDGGSLHLRSGSGGEDTDPLRITRHHRGPDSNDLRIVIGDNNSGDDSLTVGPIVTNNFEEKFRVLNNGNVSMVGDLTLDPGHFVRIGSMRLGGSWPVDVIVVYVYLGGVNGAGSTGPLSIFSRMPSVSHADGIAALAHISNTSTAIDARWAAWLTNVHVVGANEVQYTINYNVGDSDGFLWSVVTMFVMTP